MLVCKHFSGFRMFAGLRELRSNGAIRVRQGRTKTFLSYPSYKEGNIENHMATAVKDTNFKMGMTRQKKIARKKRTISDRERDVGKEERKQRMFGISLKNRSSHTYQYNLAKPLDT